MDAPRSGAGRRRRDVATLATAVLVVVLLAACNPDPTAGRRPPERAPAYTSSLAPATREDVARSWREGCPVHWRDLTVVRVAHWGYDGARHEGALVVHDSVAAAVREVFRSLYAQRFQVQRVEPVDVFGADDARSMAANNTSAFNCRRVAGSPSWSQHAYGTAVDVNPVQNPYVRGALVDPPAGRDWINRRGVVPGMAVDGGPLVGAFLAIGWSWGGHWSTAQDYQHFSLNGR